MASLKEWLDGGSELVCEDEGGWYSLSHRQAIQVFGVFFAALALFFFLVFLFLSWGR